MSDGNPIDKCRVVDVDGEPVRVRGECEPTDEERVMIAEIVRAAKARFDRD